MSDSEDNYKERELKWKWDQRWDRDESDSDSEKEGEEEDSDLEEWEFQIPAEPVNEPEDDAKKARDHARSRLEDPEFVEKIIERCPERIGDVFEIAEEGSLLIHAVNCKGVWGTGFAAQLSTEKTNAAYRHHNATFGGYGYINMTEEEQQALAGTATIIPPHPRDGGNLWVACLFTSFGFGLAKDPADVILKNTKNALQDLKRQLEELSGDKEISKFKGKIYSVRFNGGFFRVPWERTVCHLVEAGLPQVKVYTDPYCMKDADRMRFFAYMEKTGQDLEKVAASKLYWHNAALRKIASGWEPYKSDWSSRDRRWFDSDGESIHQSEDEFGSIDIFKPAKMRLSFYDRVEKLKQAFFMARFLANKNKRDLAKALREEVARIEKFNDGEMTAKEFVQPALEILRASPEELRKILGTKQTPAAKPTATKAKATNPKVTKPKITKAKAPKSKASKLVKARATKTAPKTRAKRAKAGQSLVTTAELEQATATAGASDPNPSITRVATDETMTEPTRLTTRKRKATMAEAAMESTDVIAKKKKPATAEPKKGILKAPAKKTAVAVPEEGSSVKRASTRSAAARTTKLLEKLNEEELDSDADDADVEEDDSDAFDPDV